MSKNWKECPGKNFTVTEFSAFHTKFRYGLKINIHKHLRLQVLLKDVKLPSLFLYKLQCIQLLLKMCLNFHLLQASQGLLGIFLCLNITTCLSNCLYWSLRLAWLSCFSSLRKKCTKLQALQNASRIIPHPSGNVKALLHPTEPVGWRCTEVESALFGHRSFLCRCDFKVLTKLGWSVLCGYGTVG